MIEWMSPLWFFALPLAAAPWLAWWRPHALRFGAVGAVRGGHTARVGAAVLLPALESAVIALVVVALARPQVVGRETIVETPGIDILLAIDTSGSMEAPDMGTMARPLNRLQASQIVMARFVAERTHDRVGLLTFGEEAFVMVPLTTDHDALIDFISQLELGMAGRNATAVGSAIAVGAKRMKEIDAPSRVMVLITDGQSNAGPVAPLVAAEAAAALGIRVYTIGVGASAGPLQRVLRGGSGEIDEDTLRGVAARTGGRYYRAADASALQAVYDEIDTLEMTTGRTREFVHRDERFRYALVPALVLWGIHLLSSHTLLRRLP